MSVTAEILVVGAGPAGIAAATTAAMHGHEVLVLDDNLAPGGQIWRQATTAQPEEQNAVRRKSLLTLRISGARIFSGWRVFDAPRPGVVRALHQSDSSVHTMEIAWQKLILATGACERFLPFPGWTLPGVFGAGGLQALALGGLVVQEKRIVVAGSGPLLLAVAAHLRQMGARVTTVAEQASRKQLARFSLALSRRPAKLLEGLHYRAASGGSRYRTSCWPVAALGGDRVEAVRLTDGNTTWDEPCEMLACGFHLTPNTELARLLGCRIHDGIVDADEQQQTGIANVYAAGEPTGIAGVDAALLTGTIAGLAAAGEAEKTKPLAARRKQAQHFAASLARAFALRPELRSLARPDTIVCRCEDVPYSALAGQPGWTQAKLQTRCGMGACQGRVCGAATEVLFGWEAPSVRPPLFPVPVSALSATLQGEPS